MDGPPPTLNDTEGSVGQEILVLDGTEGVLRGLERLFRESGLSVTALTDAERARDQIANRFFAVVVLDLDTPRVNGALDLVAFTKAKSPLTSTIVMTGRQTFEAVAAAFRAGATDVVPKAKEAVSYLRDRVFVAARELKMGLARESLLQEMAELHDDFLKEMMDLSRRVTDLEERILSGSDDQSGTTEVTGPLNVLIVDDESILPQALVQALSPDLGWRVRAVQSGGEALDSAGQTPPQVVIAKQILPDLPGTMVLKSIKAGVPDVVAVLFSPPVGPQGGEVKMMEGSRLHVLIPSFTDPAQLLASLEEIRQALRRKAKERRYMQIFKKEHFDFLKRYNLVKQRLAKKPGA